MFIFSYSTDDVTYTDMFSVSSNYDDDSYYIFTLPNTLSGTLYVRVSDTIRTPGVYNESTVYVDELFVRIHSDSGISPSAPRDLTVTTLSYDSIELHWLDTCDYEMGFYVERSPDGSNNWEQVGSTAPDTTYFVDTNLSPGTAYFYRVQAFNAFGKSGYTEVAGVTTIQVEALHIDSLDSSSELRRNYWGAITTITVVDHYGSAVSGATVNGSWDNGDTNTCVTDSSGQCTLSNAKLKIANVSSTTFTVIDLLKNGYIYDIESNTISSIEVLRP
jgi:hypothetical protein